MALLDQAAQPPVLRNDCFALPQGVHWTPVEDALAHLRGHLRCVTGVETLPLTAACGRYLAQDIRAARAHPPAANTAVDGYAFAGPASAGAQQLTVFAGRAAAGQPFAGTVPAGHAVRVLTGASLPAGTDTVIMQEDVQHSAAAIRFQGPLKRHANARAAGEDMTKGQIIARKGRKITAADLGMCAAAGLGDLPVHRLLRVGILSTGDELRDPGTAASTDQIYDANRPMLAALVRQWGYRAIDLGRADDDPDRLRALLDQAAKDCDIILSSGGASAGEADHMSTLLAGTGSLALWRVAMKPGRPLAMGLWGGKPVLGLPGNPVAAMVCALVFAHPALAVLAGGDWAEPHSYLLPAAFEKSKKAGRREYLRARVRDGQAEIFASEGSGRVSGLSWAEGLVMLDTPAATIRQGDPVRFIPFGSFA